jgi:hypothetical protein
LTGKQRKKNNMKNKITIALAVLALGASALVASAQDNTNTPPNGGGQDWQNGPGGPGGRMGRRPTPSPLMEALDVNHDGVIDADEIANAPAELKTLDKNGDGKLTPDELRPPRPPMDRGQNSGYDRPPGPPPGDQQDNNAAPSGPPPGNQ